MSCPDPPVSKDIYHRPADSLDTIPTLCEGCDGDWPCELAGHSGFWWYIGDPGEDEWQWVCHDCCPHEMCNRAPECGRSDEDCSTCVCGHSEESHDTGGRSCHPCRRCDCDCYFPDPDGDGSTTPEAGPE